MMKKRLLAGTIALTLAGAVSRLRNRPRTARTRQRGGRAPRMSRRSPTRASRALKAGLKLTAEQEKNWPAVETAIRDLAKQRADRMKERADRREARARWRQRAAGRDARMRSRGCAGAPTR